VLVDTNIRILRPLSAAGAWYFGAPKYPKRFVNPAMSLLRNPMLIKKTEALRFVFNIFFKIKSPLMNTKPLRFRLVSANLSELKLFF
jgi:hypothetical protein